MYFPRELDSELQNMANSYPIVTVTGPRQSGKTTLIRHVFASYPYYNLEAPDVLARIQADPKRFLRENANGAIIDEVQRYPELLSYLQVWVDEHDQPGQYILSGSQHFTLAESISQSLAGRTAVLSLLPLSLDELKIAQLHYCVDDYMLHGFYPRVYKDQLDPTKVYRDYLQTYVERDVRQLSQINNLALFQKCLRLCAGRVGQLVNYNNLANEVGVSSHTIKHWLGILQASYVITLLPPYFENFGKRMIRSPKLYFYDVGLACFLLDIHTTVQLSRDPLRGQLFENMMVIDIIKQFYHRGQLANCYFYRDSNQNEIDLIIRCGQHLIPIEIKSAETFHPAFCKNIHSFHKITSQATKGFIVYAGEANVISDTVQAYNFLDMTKLFDYSQAL